MRLPIPLDSSQVNLHPVQGKSLAEAITFKIRELRDLLRLQKPELPNAPSNQPHFKALIKGERRQTLHS